VKVALYARVSTTDKGQNPENQLLALRDYAARQGWTATEYVDQLTGSTEERPQFQAMLTAARRRDIQAIICWKLDRFGRSLRNLVLTTEQLRSQGTRLIIVTEGIDTGSDSALSRFFLHIMGSMAELEREMISERTRAGLARARQQGKKIGRPRRDVNTVAVRRYLKTHNLPQASRYFRASRSTLRRRLASAGSQAALTSSA